MEREDTEYIFLGKKRLKKRKKEKENPFYCKGEEGH